MCIVLNDNMKEKSWNIKGDGIECLKKKRSSHPLQVSYGVLTCFLIKMHKRYLKIFVN